MRHRQGAALLTAALAPLAVGAAPAGHDVVATVTNMRSDKGQVIACLTARPDTFPDCEGDPLARKLTIAASEGARLDFGRVPAGEYAISLIHDENGNGKLDKRLIIPREGFGFSNDAPVAMGPPRFSRAAFDVAGQDVRMAIRMRYLL